MAKLTSLLVEVLPRLSRSSVPLFSSRYLAHMNGDTSIPGIIGYLATMLCKEHSFFVFR